MIEKWRCQLSGGGCMGEPSCTTGIHYAMGVATGTCPHKIVIMEGSSCHLWFENARIEVPRWF